MPAMTRTSKKIARIAYNIIGIPVNIAADKDVRTSKKEADRRLLLQKTSRVR